MTTPDDSAPAMMTRFRASELENASLKMTVNRMRDAMADAVTELERGRPSRARDELRAVLRVVGKA